MAEYRRQTSLMVNIMTGRPDRGGPVGATDRRRQAAPRAWLWSVGDRRRILAGRALALVALAASLSSLGCAGRAQDTGSGWISLFDGETLAGWEGSETYFRVEDGAIVGGTDAAPIPQNEFLCRSEQWDDFEMRLRFRLEEGVNSGVQFRSERIPGSHEAIGYQADLGNGYWGALYDESRRNVVLAQADPEVVAEVLDPVGWNDYRILVEDRRIQLFINDRRTIDYTEPDATVPRAGRICVQIHSGPPGEVRFSDLRLRAVAR
jgi:hypothetical protein